MAHEDLKCDIAILLFMLGLGKKAGELNDFFNRIHSPNTGALIIMIYIGMYFYVHRF